MKFESVTRLILLLFVFSFAVSSAAQEDPVDIGIIEFGVSAGYFQFDNDRGLKNRDFTGASLGLHFSRSFSASLFYSRLHPEPESGPKYRFESYYVEGSYYWNTDSRLRPYATLGLGETLLGEGKVSDQTNLHSGLGLYWLLTPKWAVKADWRYLYSFGDAYRDQALTTSLLYRFGEGER